MSLSNFEGNFKRKNVKNELVKGVLYIRAREINIHTRMLFERTCQ